MGINKYGIKLLKKACKNNKGTTMVETIVCFVVLTIVLAALFSMVKFSSDLRMKAVDTGNLTKQFRSVIYRKANIGDSEAGGYVKPYTYKGKSDGGNTAFMLKLDMTEAEMSKNFGSAVDVSDTGVVEKLQTPVRLPNLDATAYISKDPRTKKDSPSYEGIVAPKVIEFDYHEEP